MADENQTPADNTPRKMSNTTKANTVGLTTGSLGSMLIGWAAPIIEQKYGMPAPLAAGLLGLLFVFVTHWASKLMPDD